jgi:hypothetical protein
MKTSCHRPYAANRLTAGHAGIRTHLTKVIIKTQSPLDSILYLLHLQIYIFLYSKYASCEI